MQFQAQSHFNFEDSLTIFPLTSEVVDEMSDNIRILNLHGYVFLSSWRALELSFLCLNFLNFTG